MVCSGMDHLLLFKRRRMDVREFANEAQDFLMRGDIAATAAVELDGARAIEGEADVVDHLAGAHFDDGEDLGVRGGMAEILDRERVEGDGAEDADADALCA